MTLIKLLSKQRLLWKIICIFWLTTICTILANIYITREIAFSEFKSEHFKEKTESLAMESIEIYENEGPKVLRKWYGKIYRKEGLRVALLDSKLVPLVSRKNETNIEKSETNVFKESFDLDKNLLNIADLEIKSPAGVTYLFRILPSHALKAKLNTDTLYMYRFISSFFIIFLGSLWLYRSIAKPLKVLHEASLKLSDGDFSIRTKEAIGSRKDELGQLSSAFDQMAIQIEALLSNQKQLFRDISHEIRTPLTRQKLAIELAKDSSNPLEYLDKIENQNTHIDSLINNLLTLMRLEDIPLSEFEIIDINVLLDTLIEDAELDLQSKNLILAKDQDQKCFVQCNTILLTRAFENIFMNAIKYSPEAKQIKIISKRINNKLIVIISDQGPGIPEQDLEHILKPFYRADQSRNHQTGGYGLGLAITQKIIDQHNGNLSIKNIKPTGLEVRIELDVFD